MKRPWPIVGLVVWDVSYLLYEFVHWMIAGSHMENPERFVYILGTSLFTLVSGFITYKFWALREWARILYLVGIGIGLVIMIATLGNVYAHFRESFTTRFLLHWVSWGMGGVLVFWYLSTESVKALFKKSFETEQP